MTTVRERNATDHRRGCRRQLVSLAFAAAFLSVLPNLGFAQGTGPKTGLKGEYYDWSDPAIGVPPDRNAVYSTANLRTVRIDPDVNFAWGDTGPDPSVPANRFAARWSGQVIAPETGDFTFYVAGDDGVRLWVSETPIDPANPGESLTDPAAFSDHGNQEFPALRPFRMEQGKPYNILFEYYENSGGAGAQLLWEGPSTGKGTIPTESLSPGANLKFGTLAGVVKDDSGAVQGGITVRAVGVGVAGSVVTGENGAFSVDLITGDYVLTSGDPVLEADPAPVTITEGATTTRDLVVKRLPDINLATASTDTAVTALAWGGGDDSRLIRSDDFTPAAPTFDDAAWTSVEWPADLATEVVPPNSWFWYRIKFRLPASWAAYRGRPIVLYGFQVDDSDVTFVNGQYVGHVIFQAGTARSYLVPSELLNWDGDNVIAILGGQGGGGAGSTTAAGRLRVLRQSVGALLGRVVTETGAGAPRITVNLTGPNGIALKTSTSDFDGSYRFIDLAPGNYRIKIEGLAAKLPDPVDITVNAAATTAAPNLVIQGTGFGPATLAPVDLTTLKSEDFDTEGGSSRVENNILVVEADGNDIWDVPDQYHYAYLPNNVTGDFTATVRVLDVTQGLGHWSKAGIMARNSTDGGSANVLATPTALHGVTMQWRPTEGGDSTEIGPENWWKLGSRIMLTRKGDTFSMYWTEDGSTVRHVATTEIPGIADSVMLGLAATASSSSGEVRIARFTEFMLAPVAWEPPAPQAVAPKGDMNADGRVNVQDVTIALRIAVGLLNPTDAQRREGDVNGDGQLTVSDVTTILRRAVGLIE